MARSAPESGLGVLVVRRRHWSNYFVGTLTGAPTLFLPFPLMNVEGQTQDPSTPVSAPQEQHRVLGDPAFAALEKARGNPVTLRMTRLLGTPGDDCPVGPPLLRMPGHGHVILDGE
jgi:hypothetical protein